MPPWRRRGRSGWASRLFGVATGRPFGRYRYSDKLGPRAAGVPPLLAAAAWALMARPAWAVAEARVAPRRRVRVPLACGTHRVGRVPRSADGARRLLDVASGGRYGVPVSNFGGWLATSLAVFAAWSRLDGDDRARDGGAVALLWTWLGETLASTVLWQRPRVALAGSLAMGAFALPALVRGR